MSEQLYQEYKKEEAGDEGQAAYDEKLAYTLNRNKYKDIDPERLWFDPDFNSDVLGV